MAIPEISLWRSRVERLARVATLDSGDAVTGMGRIEKVSGISEGRVSAAQRAATT